MLIMAAMRHIQSENIDACFDKFLKHLLSGSSRSQSGNYFCPAPMKRNFIYRFMVHFGFQIQKLCSYRIRSVQSFTLKAVLNPGVLLLSTNHYCRSYALLYKQHVLKPHGIRRAKVRLNCFQAFRVELHRPYLFLSCSGPPVFFVALY